MTTHNEPPLFYGLLLMPFLFLWRRLRDFLQRPFRLSLKGHRLDLSVRHEPEASDAKCLPTTRLSQKPIDDEETDTQSETVHYARDSTIDD